MSKAMRRSRAAVFARSMAGLGALVFAAIPAVQVFADSADVVYVEGNVDLQPSGGERAEANIGDTMQTGDSIITGSDGLAQLERETQAQVTVSPNTVFTIRQVSQDNQKRDVLAVTLGSIAFKFNQVAGTEPLIQTTSATAGIRGTVLTVYAGADGSSLFVVDSGQVQVSSGGSNVDLASQEGVEVTPGNPPGQKFSILHGKVDYSTWNAGKIKDVLADPAGAAANVEKQMQSYIDQLQQLQPKYDDAKAQLDAARAAEQDLLQKQGKDAARQYYEQKVYPLEVLTSGMVLNMRYYALSAWSLRQYVLGRMYTRLTSQYITDIGNPQYQAFLKVYNDTVGLFEKSVVPHLVGADI